MPLSLTVVWAPRTLLLLPLTSELLLYELTETPLNPPGVELDEKRFTILGEAYLRKETQTQKQKRKQRKMDGNMEGRKKQKQKQIEKKKIIKCFSFCKKIKKNLTGLAGLIEAD